MCLCIQPYLSNKYQNLNASVVLYQMLVLFADCVHGVLELTSSPYVLRHAVLCMGDITGSSTCSVINNNDGYYIFDPNSRETNGMTM